MSLSICHSLSKTNPQFGAFQGALTACPLTQIVANIVTRVRFFGAIAIEGGEVNLKTLIDRGFNPMEVALLPFCLFECVQSGEYPSLHEAIEKGNGLLLKFLILRGANVDAVNRSGKTPLHFATGGRHLKTMNVLIRAGANIDAANQHGITPLHHATEKGYVDAIQALIIGGANIDAANQHGSTPLHDAAYDNHFDVMKALIAARANVNTADGGGWTPLHFATGRRNVKAMNVLIRAGANIDAANRHGSTPLHFAAKNGDLDAINALVLEGARIPHDIHASLVEGFGPWANEMMDVFQSLRILALGRLFIINEKKD